MFYLGIIQGIHIYTIDICIYNVFTIVKGGDFPLTKHTEFSKLYFLLWSDDASDEPKLVA